MNNVNIISFQYWKYIRGQAKLKLKEDKTIVADFNVSTRSDYWAKTLKSKLTKAQLKELVEAIEELKGRFNL